MDNENIKLTISLFAPRPAPDNTRSIMLDVVIALIPAMFAAVWFFGLRALMVMAVSVAAVYFLNFFTGDS